MNHNQQKSIHPINTSLSKFGVEYENQFVVLDDAKHVIGVDPSDGSKLIMENLENGKAVKFGWNKSRINYITTLVYYEDTGSLYTGDRDGQVHQYKLNKTNKSCKKVRDYGNLKIDRIYSSHRFLHFVFFGGDRSNIRVLDLSTNEVLQGCLETSIGWIRSLQVCLKSNKDVYLAVSGSKTDYSGNKTDLFEVSGLLSNDSLILQKYLSKYSINQEETILHQSSTNKNKEKKIQKLIKAKISFKPNLSEINSTNNDLKEKHDQLYKKKNKQIAKANKTQRIQSETKNHQNNKITTTSEKKSLIGKYSFDEFLPFEITLDIKKDIQKEEKEKHVIKKCQDKKYEIIGRCKEKQNEAEKIKMNLKAVDTKRLQIEGNITKK